MRTNNIWEYWHSREADTVVINAGVSKNRKKITNKLFFCVSCRSSWQFYSKIITTNGIQKIIKVVEYFKHINGSCIPKEDWTICFKCEKI